jgi:HEAT repeat protein
VTFWEPVADMSAAELVDQLADPHRYTGAYRQLIGLGAEAAGPARDGLAHSSALVRMLCCKVLDHTLDRDSIPALVAALADPAADVRMQAVHALACDRCKSGDIRPSAADVLPAAIRLLHEDDHPRVRAMAVELVGAWAHTEPDATAALTSAARGDASPAVRKKASWYAPGGVIYGRTGPRLAIDEVKCRGPEVRWAGA